MTHPVQDLSLPEKIGQLFFIGIGGPELDADMRELLGDIRPGGVCLFSRNIREAKQTRNLIDDIRALHYPATFVSVDQEGGTVDRLRRIVTPIAAANLVRNAADADRLAALIAETISILGFDIDFAPVVDVVDDQRAAYSNGLFSRPFGRSKAETVEFAGAFLRILQAKGVVGCLKHFPGLGAAEVDSHEELPIVRISSEQLRETDLFPYRQLISTGDVHVIMAAHASFPASDLQEHDQNGKLLPSSLSFNFVTRLLRGELGYRGLVITDDLEMGAIVHNYGIGEACRLAIMAGVDMLAICADEGRIREGFASVLKAVQDGVITEERIDESLERIAGVRQLTTSPPAFDEERIIELSDEIADFNEHLNRR